jgi:hypothetical protein
MLRVIVSEMFTERDAAAGSREEHQEQRLLRMQPVLGLIEHD